MQQLNWDDLRVFIAVARKGRLDRAARLIDMDTSTVSRRMARLETRLGARLFEQSGTGRILTESGRRLLELTEQAERAVMLAANGASGQSRAVGGHIRLNVSEGWGAWVLPRHIASLRARHPDLVVDIIASDSFLDPRQREADIIVTVNRPDDPSLFCELLTAYDAHLFASPAYVARHGIPVRVEELSQHRIVGFIPEYMIFALQNLRKVLAPDIEESFRVTSINTLAKIVSAGVGIGVLPRFIAVHLRDLVPILAEDFRLRPNFWAVASADARDVPRIEAVLQWLREIASADAGLFLAEGDSASADGRPAPL